MATDPSDAEWESSKENFQPIKQGRSIDQLVPATSLDVNAVEIARRCGVASCAGLAHHHAGVPREFWKEIVGYKGDDPLEVWLRCSDTRACCLPSWPIHTAHRFIKWTQHTFAAGGLKAELVQLLERCTSELKGIDKYRDDVRFVRVWILYVRALLAANHTATPLSCRLTTCPIPRRYSNSCRCVLI